MSHLIFFDSSCKLCQNAVKKIQARDAQKIFIYFPLKSEKAKELLPPELLEGDTLVLLENGTKVWVRGKAVFKILQLLGSRWGWLCYLPGIDLAYRLIAHHRRFW